MYRRPVSISILAGFLSLFSAVAMILVLKAMFTADDDTFKTVVEGDQASKGALQFVAFASWIMTFICTVNILNGANWARWLYVATCGVLLLLGLFVFFGSFYVYLPSMIMRAGLIFFLFLPGADDFFRQENN